MVIYFPIGQNEETLGEVGANGRRQIRDQETRRLVSPFVNERVNHQIQLFRPLTPMTESHITKFGTGGVWHLIIGWKRQRPRDWHLFLFPPPPQMPSAVGSAAQRSPLALAVGRWRVKNHITPVPGPSTCCTARTGAPHHHFIATPVSSDRKWTLLSSWCLTPHLYARLPDWLTV